MKRNKLSLNDTPTRTQEKLKARVESKIKTNHHATRHEITAELMLLKLLDMGNSALDLTKNARERINEAKK